MFWSKKKKKEENKEPNKLNELIEKTNAKKTGEILCAEYIYLLCEICRTGHNLFGDGHEAIIERLEAIQDITKIENVTKIENDIITIFNIVLTDKDIYEVKQYLKVNIEIIQKTIHESKYELITEFGVNYHCVLRGRKEDNDVVKTIKNNIKNMEETHSNLLLTIIYWEYINDIKQTRSHGVNYDYEMSEWNWYYKIRSDYVYKEIKKLNEKYNTLGMMLTQHNKIKVPFDEFKNEHEISWDDFRKNEVEVWELEDKDGNHYQVTFKYNLFRKTKVLENGMKCYEYGEWEKLF